MNESGRGDGRASEVVARPDDAVGEGGGWEAVRRRRLQSRGGGRWRPGGQPEVTRWCARGGGRSAPRVGGRRAGRPENLGGCSAPEKTEAGSGGLFAVLRVREAFA
jgi:hypothetical protein